MDEEKLREVVSKFFRLVGDGGKFHQRQLWEYAHQQTREPVSDEACSRLNTLALEFGAKPEKKKPGLFVLEKPARAPASGTKQANLFGRK